MKKIESGTVLGLCLMSVIIILILNILDTKNQCYWEVEQWKLACYERDEIIRREVMPNWGVSVTRMGSAEDLDRNIYIYPNMTFANGKLNIELDIRFPESSNEKFKVDGFGLGSRNEEEITWTGNESDMVRFRPIAPNIPPPEPVQVNVPVK